MLLLRHQDGHLYRQEQEADQRPRDPLHDGLVADGRLCLRHPHRGHQGHCGERQEELGGIPGKEVFHRVMFL